MDSNYNLLNGYVLMSRSIFESKIWSEDPAIRCLWIWLIGHARYDFAPKKLANVTINRGELVTSYAIIAEDNQWHFNNQIKTWNKSQIHRMLNRLVEDGYIEILDDTYGTHIRICNYNVYQNPQIYKKDKDNGALNDKRTDVNNYNNKTYDNDNNGALNDFGIAGEQLGTAGETYNKDNKDNKGKNVLKEAPCKFDDNSNGKQQNNVSKESKSDSLETPASLKKSKSSKKITDPRVNEVKTYFIEHHPVKPFIVTKYGQFMSNIKSIINAIDPISDDPVSDIKKLIDEYFKSKDTFYKKRGYDFGTFMSNLNGLKLNKTMTIDERADAFEARLTEMGVN